ncbi:MAG: excinuclease ABC subunit UvrC [Verrucomicrobiae bacterium]|nr:excinuclease ABC subunit UvrC [Verrucomicrobiae bacterium]
MNGDQKLPPHLKEKLSLLPHRPGIYLFKDRFHRVIYVGKARDLYKRVHQYFHSSRRATADLKTRALIEAIHDLEFHTVRSEPEALLLEGKLIKQFRPRYNISFRDDKRFLLVRVNLADPFPRFQLTRLRRDDGCRYFGPFPHSSALRSTLNLMKKLFGLRSCHPATPTEADYRHCLDHVIKNCSAPCIGKISPEAYKMRVQQACDFLEGHTQEMRARLRVEMEKAAAEMQFEKAAQLRDLLQDLERTTTPQRRFVKQFVVAIDPARDLEDLAHALHLPAPPHLMECFDISNISDLHKVASMVSFRNGKPNPSAYRRYRIRTVEGQDDFACIAEVVRRRYTRLIRLSEKLPALIIVDGGKGQLNAARAELHALGLHHIPIIGLAKEEETIHLPDQPEPLRLDPHSGALRMLQRIRDEAHRVANTYHQLLLNRRIKESILDDCPGISLTRRTRLLAHFGSIERLKTASVEEIATVPGIGRALAETLHQYLQSLKSNNV